MTPAEAEIFKNIHSAENKFEEIINKFEKRLIKVDVEIKEKARTEFKEIILAFNDLKQALELRFKMALEIDRQAEVKQAVEEISKLFEILFDVLEDDMQDYDISNKTQQGSSEIVASIISRKNADQSLSELVFNFVPTQTSQARVAINWYEDAENRDQSKNYSLRVGQDEKFQQVAIDIDTPMTNRAFNRLEDENGSWHHFKSKNLQAFIQTDRFTNLVEAFKDVILQTEKQFSLQDLINKYNQKDNSRV